MKTRLSGSTGTNEPLELSRIELILAEKRTSLSVMRTGIMVFTLPLSVLTVLITTSRYFNFWDNYFLIIPLLGICAGLIILAIYLVHRSIVKIRKLDELIESIKRNDPALAEFFKDAL